MRFQHLESLSLCGCTELNDSGLTRLLSYGSNLQKLNLDCCLKVTDYGLSLVASGCPSLTSISLYRCINISDDGLETLATACLSLKCINLSYCSQISDKGLKALTQRCCQLQAVNISHCESIRGVGFKGCSKSLTHVEAWSCKLNPEGVTGIISGGGIEYLDVSCLSWYPLGDTLLGIRLSSNLKVLNFRMCRSVSDTSIVAIAMGCTLLEEWNLALCHEVRISGWQAVGLYCQNLKRLHVNRCRNLNDNGLQALRDGCRSLSVLYLNGCVHVTPFALELFKSHRANVCIKDEEKLGEGVKGVYISIDVDCLDPAFAPGVSHIEPGGLSFCDVLNILHNLQGDVVAGDVVELNPQRDTVDGMTAMVAAKLVREMAAKIAK
ncbi:hypothetical protein RYX36_003300 [Vicia faba]